MPAKLDRCVQDIKDKGEADGVNPWAVCKASIGELKAEEPDKLLNELDDIISGDASFPPTDASYKHTGNMVPTESDHSYENTATEEKLKEIDDMISKDAVFPKPNASYKFTGDMTTKLRPNTFGNTGNETVSIPGSLSAVKIKGKKREGSSMMQETVYKAVLDTKLNNCGCLKKKRLTETQEGGPGSGPKKGAGGKAHPLAKYVPKGGMGSKARYDPETGLGTKASFDVPKGTVISKSDLPKGMKVPKGATVGEAINKQLIDSKLNEGGPGSGIKGHTTAKDEPSGEPSGQTQTNFDSMWDSTSYEDRAQIASATYPDEPNAQALADFDSGETDPETKADLLQTMIQQRTQDGEGATDLLSDAHKNAIDAYIQQDPYGDMMNPQWDAQMHMDSNVFGQITAGRDMNQISDQINNYVKQKLSAP